MIPTYCNDTIVHVPPAPTAEEDQQLMGTTGRKLAESYLQHPPLFPREVGAVPPNARAHARPGPQPAEGGLSTASWHREDVPSKRSMSDTERQDHCPQRLGTDPDPHGRG
jgi:hypothetical protein